MEHQPEILVSAGEASGDLYASELVGALRSVWPGARFFGCAGPRMRAAGVEAIIESESLSVVGLAEVVHHLPRIWREFQKLVAAARARRPDLAIVTDSPDFHMRLARKLRPTPVVYLVAPQVWAWRKERLPALRRDFERLLCIFPFEPEFFASHGVPASYIGHPLTRLVRPNLSRDAFLRKHGIGGSRPLITALPGSRIGEVARHLPSVVGAVERIRESRPVAAVLATPPGFRRKAGEDFFRERIGLASIQLIEGETWDAIAHSDLVLAASGTVTIEAALLGAPMVTYYKVTGLSWWMGKFLVRVPFYSMVNLIAGRKVVPELMQSDLTPDRLAAEALRLLDDPAARAGMKNDLAEVSERLRTGHDPMETAAREVAAVWKRHHPELT